jgi:hypothetical protein
VPGRARSYTTVIIRAIISIQAAETSAEAVAQIRGLSSVMWRDVAEFTRMRSLHKVFGRMIWVTLRAGVMREVYE